MRLSRQSDTLSLFAGILVLSQLCKRPSLSSLLIGEDGVGDEQPTTGLGALCNDARLTPYHSDCRHTDLDIFGQG